MNLARKHTMTAAEAVLESDVGYFAAGARQRSVSGFVLHYMEGLTHLPAGCVAIAQRNPAPERAISELEDHFRELGCGMARIYLQHDDPGLVKALYERAYEDRCEVALRRAIDAPHKPGSAEHPSLSVIPVEGARHWAHKSALHARLSHGPDGYPFNPDRWVELERRKAASGYMELFLLEQNGAVCGGFGLSFQGPMVRLKNVLVHPDHRRRGLASWIGLEAARVATTRGKQAAGCLAVPGGYGERAYRRAGYTVVGQQFEWTKPLK